jgi:hypothetical protein
VGGEPGGLGGEAENGPPPGGVGDGDLGEWSAFWGVDDERSAPAGERPGAVSRPDGLLDQLDPPALSHHGRPIVDLLRTAYRALPER